VNAKENTDAKSFQDGSSKERQHELSSTLAIQCIDSHCHLSQLRLNQDESVAEVLSQAADAGVTDVLCVAVDLDDATALQSKFATQRNVHLSAGIHPLHSVAGVEWSHRLQQLLQHSAVVATGETGLDYYYATDHDSRLRQREHFTMHCQLASEAHKPLIVHTREALSDTLNILRQGPLPEVPGVIHCFTGNWAAAEQFLQLGFYISFSGIVTFNNAQDIREAAKKVPLERMLIETDSPYLAPIPHRGKANFPRYVVDVGRCIAVLRDISWQTLAATTSENFQRLFLHS